MDDLARKRRELLFEPDRYTKLFQFLTRQQMQLFLFAVFWVTITAIPQETMQMIRSDPAQLSVMLYLTSIVAMQGDFLWGTLAFTMSLTLAFVIRVVLERG